MILWSVSRHSSGTVVYLFYLSTGIFSYTTDDGWLASTITHLGFPKAENDVFLQSPPHICSVGSRRLGTRLRAGWRAVWAASRGNAKS